MKRRYHWTPQGVVEEVPAESPFQWIKPDLRGLDEIEQLLREGRQQITGAGVPPHLLTEDRRGNRD